MDFDWTQEQASFRSRVSSTIEGSLPPDWEELAEEGPASSRMTEFARSFCGRLAAEGLLTPHWDEAHGGSGLDAWHQIILAEEMWRVGEPRGGQYMNVNWIGPTLLKFGTDEQRDRYLPPITRGEALWCQGFSEPGAGSDLASLRTAARRDGADYVVNGQKIWTSYAGLADTCFLLCRTATGASHGITILLVPMDTPGITVRQIPSLIGEGDIHEVFFDDVRVPQTARLGEEGAAWDIIRFSLINERLGIPRYALARDALDRSVALLGQRGGFSDAVMLYQASLAAAQCEAARLASYAIISDRIAGLPAGADSSSARFATIMAERSVAEFIVEHCADVLVAGSPFFKMHHQRAIVAGLAAGAAEIQLNIIASQVLELPREAR